MNEARNTLTDVAQIVWWNKVDVNHYEARVVYRDGTNGSYDHLTQDGWDIIKDAEQQADLDEANAPVATKVEDRNGHVERGIIKLGTAMREIPLNEEDRDDEQIGMSKTHSDDIKRGQINNYSSNPDHYGCCAWCHHYWNRNSGRRAYPKMTDEQFEATRLDGTSHGCCPECKIEMLAEGRRQTRTFPVGTPIKVTNTADEMADSRNVGRLGVVRNIIIAPTEGMDALYEIEFTDGDREPHWMDVEAGLTNGNSTHFHGELERI